jgi:acetoin utilization deacetylase AcuC-like enzyme
VADPRDLRASSPGPTTALVLHADCGRHDTGWGHPEHQGRLPAILQALYQDTPTLLDRVLQHEATPASIAQLRRVHTDAHIARVRDAGEVAQRTGRAVYLDPETIVSPASWDAACAAAGCAIDAVGLVLDGTVRSAFALTRPPGHHATSDSSMGFCLFNNAAVAARAAQAVHDVERVLIIDWDVHHGNGTQDIFYDDPRVYYLSIHLAGHYPGTGWIDERGAGAGYGTTRNVPLAHDTPAADTLQAFDTALSATLAEFEPQLTIVSAGFDCLAGDPLGGLLLEPADLRTITGTITERVGSPVALVLEGGYAPARMAQGVLAVFHALAGLAH